MATGRTVKKHARFYLDGNDLSGEARTFGPLRWTHDTPELTTLTDAVVGRLPDHASVSVGSLAAVLVNASSGVNQAVENPGVPRTVLAPLGIRAAPAAGDPAFMGRFLQGQYVMVEEGGAIGVMIPFGEWDGADLIDYGKPWGHLVHAYGAETAANNSTADVDGLASSTAGGYGVLQVFAGDGTATISIEHSNTNTDGAFDSAGDVLAFDTTDCSAPFAEVKALGSTATVNRYLRWQISLGTASTVTFAIGFVRG